MKRNNADVNNMEILPESIEIERHEKSFKANKLFERIFINSYLVELQCSLNK